MPFPSSSRPSLRLRLLAASLAAALTACASAPSAPVASVDVPARWYNGASADALAAPHGEVATAGAAWWRDFGSAELAALVDRALDANRDLHLAAARVEQAHALAGEADADRLPRLDATAVSSDGRETTLDPKARLRNAGLLASWEADLFGLKGLAARAAQLDAQGAELQRAALRTAIAAQVASIYVDAAGVARRVTLAQQRLALAVRAEAVLAGLYRAGQATHVDVDNRRVQTRSLRAEVAELDGALRLRRLQLAVLVGATPGSLATEFVDWADWADQSTVAPPHWLPGELLEQRPDVQRAAREVDAAAARVGVARLDLYPKFVFRWANKRERAQIVDESAATDIALGYGVSIMLPIFDGGRIRSRIAVSEARLQEAMAAYEKTMLEALADAETALVRADVATRTLDDLGAAAHAADGAAGQAERLYAAGLIDQGALLDAHQSALQAQDLAVQARSAEWLAAVDVRRALCADPPGETASLAAVTK